MGNCMGRKKRRRGSDGSGSTTRDSNPDTLYSGRYDYVKGVKLGAGSYGEVYSCTQLPTFKKVALKITKDQCGRREAAIMEMFSGMEPEKKNLLPMLESFPHGNTYCLVFEMLDVNLSRFMALHKLLPFRICQIRPIVQQMLVALQALKTLHIIHADIKPDNIMFVNCKNHPFKVMLIDFGLARQQSEMDFLMNLQVLGYRAPEILLGQPGDEKIDMWSLGCVMARMYIGVKNIFPVHCPYEYIRAVVQMVGQPPDEILATSPKWQQFFAYRESESAKSDFRLLTQKEFMSRNGVVSYQRPSLYTKCAKIENLPRVHPKPKTELEYEDSAEFMSLLKQMLHVDRKRRISPTRALKHDFITMAPLSRKPYHPYTVTAREIMQVCGKEMSSLTHSSTPELQRSVSEMSHRSRGRQKYRATPGPRPRPHSVSEIKVPKRQRSNDERD